MQLYTNQYLICVAVLAVPLDKPASGGPSAQRKVVGSLLRSWPSALALVQPRCHGRCASHGIQSLKITCLFNQTPPHRDAKSQRSPTRRQPGVSKRAKII